MAILDKGDKVLVVYRRMYASDMPHYFVGTVEDFAEGLAAVSGYSWEKEQFAGQMNMIEGIRTKIVPIASGTVLAYLLPREVEIERLVFETLGRDKLWLTDRARFRMNIAERTSPTGGAAFED